jgi:cytochrome o ubiquinol oxidase subunit 1
VVSTRDPWWEQKQLAKDGTKTKPVYKDILMPKNTSISVIIGILSLFLGFGVIWHIWWLVLGCLFLIITSLIIRLTEDDTDYYLKASEIEATEKKLRAVRDAS